MTNNTLILEKKKRKNRQTSADAAVAKIEDLYHSLKDKDYLNLTTWFLARKSYNYFKKCHLIHIQ